jgi:predicted enzyme related to lactoylglutathione lyase
VAKALGPDFVALQVRDLGRSREFYVERLGLRAAPQSPPGAVVFQTQPIPFAVREPLVNLDSVDKLGWGVALWLLADDADGLCSLLEETGVTIASPLEDGPFGRTFAFVDPDGYCVTVHSSNR